MFRQPAPVFRRPAQPLLLAALAAVPAAFLATGPAAAADATRNPAAPPAKSSRNLTCAPSPEVKAALATVPRRDPDCDPSDPCWVEKIRKAEALLDRYPFDVHVHRRYQDLVTARSNQLAAAAGGQEATETEDDPVTKAATDRYARFVAENPSDPLAHYLLARFNDDESEARRALELNPTFPWPHGLLATLLMRPKHPGGDVIAAVPIGTPPPAVAAGAEIEAFARLCPSRFDEVLRRDDAMGDAALWRRLLPPAREALKKGPPAEQVPWYQALWDHEFSAWPPTEHDAVRRRVKDDLARIESWKKRDDERWWQTLQAGYKMLDDPAAQERVTAAYVKRFPCSFEGISRTIDAFVASRGGQEHLHDQTQEQWRDASAQSGRWLKACPDDYRYLSYHFEATARLDSTTDAALVAEADAYLAGWDRISSTWTVYPSPEHEVAAEFLSRGIQPARALELARKSQQARAVQRAAERAAEHKAAAAAAQGSDPADDEQGRRQDEWSRAVDFDDQGLVAEAALAAGRRDECEVALSQAGDILTSLGIQNRLLAAAFGSRSRYWRVRARLAEADQNRAGALGYWRLAVEQADRDTFARSIAQDRAALERHWRSLGGTDEQLALFMTPVAPEPSTAAPAGSSAAPSPGSATAGKPAAPAHAASALEAAQAGWDPAGDAMPAFSLTDLGGRSWTLAELSGKTLFINVWATWCGPCQAEIPHLRDLNDRLRGRNDVILLSFNTDESPGAVLPFARAHQMTWPVLFANLYFEGLPGAASVPQNWVVDGAGVRRNIQLGFDPRHADAWLETALAVIDRAATAAPAATAQSPSTPHPPSNPPRP